MLLLLRALLPWLGSSSCLSVSHSLARSLSLSLSESSNKKATDRIDINNCAYQLYTRRRFVASSSCWAIAAVALVCCIVYVYTCVSVCWIYCVIVVITTPYNFIVSCMYICASRRFLLLLQQTIVSREKLSGLQTGSVRMYICMYFYTYTYVCIFHWLNSAFRLRVEARAHGQIHAYTQKVEYANMPKEFVTVFGAVESFRKLA